MQICCGDSGDAGVDGITTSDMEQALILGEPSSYIY